MIIGESCASSERINGAVPSPEPPPPPSGTTASARVTEMTSSPACCRGNRGAADRRNGGNGEEDFEQTTTDDDNAISSAASSEDRFYGPRREGKRPEEAEEAEEGLKVSSAFVDMSATTRNLSSLGRDRAKSESGKDSVFASIAGSRVHLPPRKSTARRVDSIKKSLIKLGSFVGKDAMNGGGRGKGRKEKGNRSNSDDGATTDLPPLKRTGSDRIGGPFSLGLSNLMSHKSPEVRSSGRYAASPLPSLQANISHPLAVHDPEKLEEFSKQKLNTMQMMYEQARRECEELKHEYQKKPTEMVHANLEAKVKVVRRLESHLSMYGNESDTPSGEKRICYRGSSIESSLPVSDGDRDTSTRMPPTPSYAPKHKERDGGAAGADKVKQEVQLTRSHSDSYKGPKKEIDRDSLRFAASTGEIRKFTVAASDNFDIGLHHDSDSFGHSKSHDAASNESSDSGLNRLGLTPDLPPLTQVISDNLDNSRQQSNIIAIDDYEFNHSDDENSNQFEDIGSPFNDFSVLKNRPAHLAVFLQYLIYNSDASPLLFYLMSGQNYSTGAIRGELRKWAYEIFSTFLVDGAPWRVKAEESYIEAINYTLLNKFDKEDEMRNLFLPVREKFALPQIKALLSEYQSKRALGLGALYGENQLKGLDHNLELKVVDKILWKDFKQAADDDCERSQVFASVLATYFKQIGCINAHNAHLLELYPTFNAKDKTRFSVFGIGAKRERAVTYRGHNLLPQHYFVVTNCNLCQSVLFGVGSQGYQCQKCDQNFHKNCREKIKETCSGKKFKPSNVFDKFINKKTSTSEEPPEDDLVMESQMERTTSMPSIRDVGKFTALSYKPSFGGLNLWEKARGHKDSSVKGMDKGDPLKSMDDAKPLSTPVDLICSDVLSSEEHQNDPTDATKSSPPSYTSSLVFNVLPYSSSMPQDGLPSYSTITCAGDPELDVEQDLPPLEAIIPKEHLKKLDKKEKKRQEVINELFYTEKSHLRDIKVVQLFFYSPMLQEPSLVELADFVFPRISEIVEFHSNLSNEFQQKRKASNHHIVGDFADILVNNFSGEKGESFKRACGQFCEKQSQAQEQLKAQQRKDPKLVSLLQAAASNPFCRRLMLKDFLPIPMQRLTKYPLLIENLMKHTPAESEEYSRLQSALGFSREILLFVNKTVSEYQNGMKLAEIEKKLDTRPMENSSDPLLKEYKNFNLLNHVLLHDGLLSWRIRRDRIIPIHVVLLDSTLLLLQKQDDRLVLRCENTQVAVAGKDDRRKMTHSPIIKLTNVLVRPVATDIYAFFLINVSSGNGSGSQIYDLIASSKEEKNRWCNHINIAQEMILKKEGLKSPVPRIPHIPVHRTHHPAESDSSQVDPDLDRKHEGTDAIYETSEIPSNDDLSIESSVGSFVDPIEQLKQVDSVIRHKMCERMKIWSQLWHQSGTDDDKYELLRDSNVRKHLAVTLLETNQLMHFVNSRCEVAGSESTTDCSTGSPETPQLDPDKALHNGSGMTATIAEDFHRSTNMSFPITKIMELNNSIHKHLMLLLESVIHTDEERRKLLVDLRLAKEKLACLELSDSQHHKTKYSLDQTLSEMIADFDEKIYLPAISGSNHFDSAIDFDATSIADRFGSEVVTDDVSAGEKIDTSTSISPALALASDFPDNATSTDA